MKYFNLGMCPKKNIQLKANYRQSQFKRQGIFSALYNTALKILETYERKNS